MPFDVQILTRKIQGLKEAFINGRFSDALSQAITEGNGEMQQRIFERGEDIIGQSFGNYIGRKTKTKLVKSSNRTQNKRNKAIAGTYLTSYQRKRASKGRQVLKKDLDFTGTLRRSIETQVVSENAAVLAFTDDLSAKIARGQENQISNIRNGVTATTRGAGTKIFRLNKAEREIVIDQGVEAITQILKK